VSKKVLLVFDDYSEMMRIQTDLMKVGFDVVGIVNEALLSDQLLSFHPDLVLSAGRGGKVSAPSVAQKLKDNARFHAKVLLLLPPSQRPSAQELARIRMDSLLEMPVGMGKLLVTIAKLLSLESEPLVEKFLKSRMAEGASQDEIQQLRQQVRGDRASRYEKAMKGLALENLQATSFDRQKIKDAQQDMKKGWNIKDLEDQDQKKREFVEALFKKPKP